KVIVARARKIQRFLSQPFFVGEKFTGVKGVYVPIEETVQSFEALVNGELDEVPEQAFFNVGGVESVLAKAKTLEEGGTGAAHRGRRLGRAGPLHRRSRHGRVPHLGGRDRVSPWSRAIPRRAGDRRGAKPASA